MWDVETVEVYVNQELVCCHSRSFIPYGYTTEKSHMPEKHLAYEHRKEVNAATLIGWGANIGLSVKWAVEDILKNTTFPQQAYGRCTGIIALAKKYGRSRLDHACSIMREEIGSASYKSIATMLKNGQDLDNGETMSRLPLNDDVRGAEAYRSVSRPEDRKENDHGE